MSHKFLYLILILIVAFGLRIVNLGTAPRGIHADEISFIINSQSLLATGKDEDGQALPIQLNSFIDPKPALYSYLQVPFFAVLGPSVFASRLPSVMLGVISIGLLYTVIKNLAGQRLGLWVAFLAAVSPWHILNSRATQEVILSFVFSLLALLAFQKLLTPAKSKLKKSVIWLSVLGISCLLAMYSYHSAKVFLPLFFGGWGLVTWCNNQSRKQFIKLALAALVVVMALGVSLLGAGSTARFQSVGVLSNPLPQLLLEEQILQATGLSPLLLLRVFYNKLTFYALNLIDVYAQHFTVDFLFLTGGQPLRYQIPYHGLLFLIELFLIPYGLMLLFKEHKHKAYRWFIGLSLVLAPLPAALTFIETPSTIRTFPLIMPLLFISALSLEDLWQKRRSLIQGVGLAVVSGGYLWGISFFFHQLIVQLPVHQPWHRNEPYQEIAQLVKQYQPDYDRIIVTNDLRPLYSYFVYEGLISFSTLQAQPLLRNQAQYSLGTFTFNRGICEFGPHQTRTLYIGEIGCPTDGRKSVTTVSYGDGTPAYGLWEEAEPQ